MRGLGSHRASTLARLLRAISHTPWWVRWALFFALWAAGAALLATTPTTEVAHHGPLQAAYASVKLFALDPPGYPLAPSSWQGAALWAVIVAAPVLTATAAAEFLRRHVLAPEVLARGFQDHAVICGLGNHGRVIAQACAQRGEDVVVVDANPGAAGTQLDLGRRDGLVLRGDMTERDALLDAGVLRARRVVLSSGNPLQNLEAARLVRALCAEHGVEVPRLHALVDQTDLIAALLPPLGLRREDLVDQFAAASAHLVGSAPVQAALSRIGAGTVAPHVAIVGFGRFGQAVLRQLLTTPCLPPPGAEGPPMTVQLVDFKADQRGVHAARRVATRGWRLVAPRGGDAERWVAAQVALPAAERPSIVFLCVDNDMVSLRCASRLRRAGDDVAVVLRVARPLSANDHDVVTYNVPELFSRCLSEVLG